MIEEQREFGDCFGIVNTGTAGRVRVGVEVLRDRI